MQLVRDLEARGVLPPAPRSAGGYRQFGQVHVHSVRAYRGLAQGAGFPVAREILQTLHAGDVEHALTLLDAAHAAIHTERAAVAQARLAADFIAAEPILEKQPGDSMTIGDLAAALGLRTSTLRFWEAQGLVAAGRDAVGGRVFEPGQIRDVRIVAQLRAAGYGVPAVREVLGQLASEDIVGVLDQRRATLADRSRALVRAAASLQQVLEGV